MTSRKAKKEEKSLPSGRFGPWPLRFGPSVRRSGGGDSVSHPGRGSFWWGEGEGGGSLLVAVQSFVQVQVKKKKKNGGVSRRFEGVRGSPLRAKGGREKKHRLQARSVDNSSTRSGSERGERRALRPRQEGIINCRSRGKKGSQRTFFLLECRSSSATQKPEKKRNTKKQVAKKSSSKSERLKN